MMGWADYAQLPPNHLFPPLPPPLPKDYANQQTCQSQHTFFPLFLILLLISWLQLVNYSIAEYHTHLS